MTFQSRHTPAGAARAAVLFRAQTDALAWGAFALMTVTLAAVLEGASVWGPLGIGLAAVYLASALIARGRLDRTVAAVEVDGDAVRVWSVWDAAAPARRPAAVAVWEARLVRGELVVSLGDAVETFSPADWADFDALVEAMKDAGVDTRSGDASLSLTARPSHGA